MKNIDKTVKNIAEAIDLPLNPEHQAGVVKNFAKIAEIAQIVMEFPLPETLEAAPKFEP